MKLGIMGTGYVGLVTGVGFANLGNEVVCLDVDKLKIDRLQNGDLTIYEPGLKELFTGNLESGRIRFTTDAKETVQFADIIFICVGTPSAGNHAADLSAVKESARAVGRHMESPKVVVNKSTVPVGTAKMVRVMIEESQRANIDFDVVSNPEFLREGAAVKDFENPDRIVIGVSSQRAEDVMRTLYKPVSRANRQLVVTTPESAELIKYAANSMLATRISFMNQLSGLCEKVGADIKTVAQGIGLDSRIGHRFLHAGSGYGGSCFPKDVKALIATMREYKCDAGILEAVHRANERQKTVAVDKLKALMDLQGLKIALWGLAFKPKTDDVREAPSLEIIKELQESGAAVHAYDPVAMYNARREVSRVKFFNDPYDAVKGCDALILVTEWDEFRNPDIRALKSLMRRPVIIDGRNIYDPDDMRAAGFAYMSIGRQ